MRELLYFIVSVRGWLALLLWAKKREHHGGVVVEFDHLLAAREQRERPIEQDSSQDVFPSDPLPPTRPHPPMFLKHHRIMPENQAFNTWAYRRTSQTQTKTEGCSVHILCLVAVPDSDLHIWAGTKEAAQLVILCSSLLHILLSRWDGGKDRRCSTSEF